MWDMVFTLNFWFGLAVGAGVMWLVVFIKDALPSAGPVMSARESVKNRRNIAAELAALPVADRYVSDAKPISGNGGFTPIMETNPFDGPPPNGKTVWTAADILRIPNGLALWDEHTKNIQNFVDDYELTNSRVTRNDKLALLRADGFLRWFNSHSA